MNTNKQVKKIKPVRYTGFTKNRPRKAVKFSVLIFSTENFTTESIKNIKTVKNK